MTINYEKVWEVMNDLEVSFNKITYIKEILESSIECIDNAQYDRAEALTSASKTLVEWFITEYDEKFRRAWNNTVRELKSQELESIRNHYFTETEPKEVTQAEESEKTILPVEEAYDSNGNTIFSYITFPDSLLQKVNWSPGDILEWNDQGDGSFTLKKQGT